MLSGNILAGWRTGCQHLCGKKFVIRFRIKERLADRQFATGRNVTLTELAEAIGVTRGTVSKMANQYNYNATIEIVDRLCRYFDCSVEQILEYIPDDKARRSGAGSSDGR